MVINMKNILILCTGNSCRSQIAHGYLEHFKKEATTTIYSAGIEVHGVNPKAIATMKEDGIDISNNTSNNSNEYSDIEFDYVITVCDNAKENCPIFSTNAVRLHHNFTDPAKATGTENEVLESFRTVRSEIKKYCQEFILKYQI